MEEVRVIYEDDDIIAVNKPAGLLVHRVTRYPLHVTSVVDWLLKKYPEIKNVGEDPMRPGIVHRLDKDTSGVLLVAKNQKAFEYLKEQFQNRKIKKKYIALVCGDIKNDKGIIDLPIGKSKKDFRKKEARTEAGLRGKTREAITEYKVLKRFKNFTLVEAFPKTGRTHQLRVHFKAIGHPVVGDKLYGHPDAKIGRQFLHAQSIELNLQDGSRIKIEAGLPEDLSRIITK